MQISLVIGYHLLNLLLAIKYENLKTYHNNCFYCGVHLNRKIYGIGGSLLAGSYINF